MSKEELLEKLREFANDINDAKVTEAFDAFEKWYA